MARSWIVRLAGLGIGSCGTILYLLNDSVKAGGQSPTELPSYPWRFSRMFQTFDHAALRRGWQIYKTICSTCHSLQFVRFMDLIDVTHTAAEARAIAEEYEVEDGPDDEGNYFKRPARVSEKLPPPFPNEAASRAANFGSYPPDLTFIVCGRHDGPNYVFSYLTGWKDPPAGIHLGDGQHFNPYFPGTITGMAQILFDGIVEYEDGTPATESQMAKDVVEFLSWTAAPEHDTRMLMLLKILGVLTVMTISILDLHKRNMSHLRSRRIAHITKRAC